MMFSPVTLMDLSSSSWATSWYIPTQWIHVEHLGKGLEALHQHRLYAKASKCSIMEEEVEFLGQWMTPQGAAPLKEKIKAVVEWEAPQDLKGVRSFSGFANYYCCFVQGYAELASPLTYLTKKDIPWVWGPLNDKLFRS